MKHNIFFRWILGAGLLSVVIFFAVSGANAQGSDDELISVTSEGTTTAPSPTEAAREIQAKAVSGSAREQVIEIIGEKRYAKNKALVENRIVRESAKFIPFVQPGDPVKLPDGSWKMKVDLKISLGSLRKMVIDTGLMTDADTPVTMVPLIAFTDRTKGLNYRWWMADPRDDLRKSLIEWSSVVQLGLHKELMRQGFHLLLPVEAGLSNALPPVFRVDRPASQDLRQIGEYMGVSMALRGDVRVKEAREGTGSAGGQQNQWQILVRLEVLPVQGGRTVAEISRTLDTDVGPAELVVKRKLEKEISEMAKDLATQVFDAWTRGTLAATTVKLAVRGNLSPKQLGDFRSQMTRSVRDVKAIRERLFEPGRVVFEIDFAASPEEFKERLKAMELPGFTDKLVVDSELGEADGLTVPYTIDLKPKTL